MSMLKLISTTIFLAFITLPLFAQFSPPELGELYRDDVIPRIDIRVVSI